MWKAAAFSDDFNRPDSTNLNPNSLFSDWTESAGDLGILDHQLWAIGAAGGTALVNKVSLADVRVEAQVSILTTGSSSADLLARASNVNNAYVGSLLGDDGTVTAVIRKIVGGDWSPLAAAPVNAPFGEGVLRFEAAGSLLRLFFNDTLVASAIDTTFKSGKVGAGGTQFVSLDDFFASPVDPDLPFGDSFDRNADSTSLGSLWRQQAGNLRVRSNHPVAMGSGGNLSIYQGAALKDVSAQAQVSVFSPAGWGLTGSAGLVARYTGNGDKNYYLGALVGSNGVFTARIYRNVAGTFTQLASAPVGSGSDYGSGLLRFEVLGQSLQLFVNGKVVSTGQAWAASVRTTDTTLSGPGQVGLRGTPRSVLDTFNAQALFPTLFFDGFNRPDATDLGSRWQTLRGAVGIASSQAKATAVGNLAVRGGVLLKDVKLEAQVTVLPTGISQAGLVARVQDASNYYYAALEGNAGRFSVSIYRVVDNVKTRIGAAAPVESSRTSRLRFEVVGRSLKLFFNRTLLVNVTDDWFTAAGLAGLRGSQDTLFDDFSMA